MSFFEPGPKRHPCYIHPPDGGGGIVDCDMMGRIALDAQLRGIPCTCQEAASSAPPQKRSTAHDP